MFGVNALIVTKTRVNEKLLCHDLYTYFNKYNVLFVITKDIFKIIINLYMY